MFSSTYSIQDIAMVRTFRFCRDWEFRAMKIQAQSTTFKEKVSVLLFRKGSGDIYCIPRKLSSAAVKYIFFKFLTLLVYTVQFMVTYQYVWEALVNIHRLTTFDIFRNLSGDITIMILQWIYCRPNGNLR
jgi:hypothetical protein